MTDMELLEQLRGKNGIEQLSREYKPLIASIARARLSSEQDVEEVCEDALMKIISHAEDIDLSRCSLRGYVAMVSSGCTVDKLRRNRRQDQEVSIEDLPASERDLGVDLDLTDEVARRHNIQLVAKLIRRLPQPDRDIFIDRYYFGLSVKECAQRSGVNTKRAENILYRRKKWLKKQLLKGGVLL